MGWDDGSGPEPRRALSTFAAAPPPALRREGVATSTADGSGDGDGDLDGNLNGDFNGDGDGGGDGDGANVEAAVVFSWLRSCREAA